MDRTPKLRLIPGNVAPKQTTYAAVREIADLLTAYEQAIYAYDFDKAIGHMQAVVFCSVHLLDVANRRKQAFSNMRVVQGR